jgi:flagellar biosynthesis chaperone FliJ
LSLKEKLEILRRNLGTLNSEINSYNSKLHSLEFECNQYQDRLGSKLPDGEGVTECWKNKDFFEKLNSKASLIVRQDAQMAL